MGDPTAQGAGGSDATGSGPRPCLIDGHSYPDGARIPSDECSQCVCEDGDVDCTDVECTSCSDLETSYADAVQAAKECDPFDSEPCSELVPSALHCGCPTFVVDASEASALASSWDMAECTSSDACGECGRELGHATCSDEGECIDVPLAGTGDGCSFEYLGDLVYCEHGGWPATLKLTDATSLEDCFEACRQSPRCTAVTDYFWLGRSDLGCYLYESTCDAPGRPTYAEEDSAQNYRKVCDSTGG